MAYIKTTWTDNESPYLNAYNLNKIEEGIHSTAANTDTNTDNIADNTENIADNRTDIDINAGNILGLSVGEVYQGTWTPEAGTEYPTAPEGGWSYYIQFLDDDGYTFTGGDLVGRVANNSDKIIYNGTSWSMLDNTSTQLGYYLVDDIESMLALSPLQGALCEVYGYHEANDGGGGSFNYDANLESTNNGGTIIDGWVRIKNGAANVRWFGAKGDGVTDDSEAFNNAFLASQAVVADEGVYIADNLNMDNNTLFGGGTIQHKAAATTPLINVTGECTIRGMHFDGDSDNQTTAFNFIDIVNGKFSTIASCFFTKTYHKTISTDVANSDKLLIEANNFVSCGVIANCNVIDIRSSYCKVIGNSFVDTGNGHCVRIGLFTGDPTGVPVKDTVVSGNILKDSLHVGVTCEIYAEGVSITGNTFNGLDQAVKCETSETVKGVVVTGNVIKNIALPTALNIKVEGILFSANHCEDVHGVCDLGDNAICSDNYFKNCGLVDQYTLRQVSTVGGAIITGNIILDSPLGGISVANGANVSNNRIINAVGRSINCAGVGVVVSGNFVDGGEYGILLSSVAGDFIVDDNVILNTTVKAISYSANAASKSSYIGKNIGFDLGSVSIDIVGDEMDLGVNQSLITVGTEGGATTDNLSTITAAGNARIIVLRIPTSSRVVTVKDNVGNIRLANGADFVFNSNVDTLTLAYTGSAWVEVSRSLNY